MITYDHGLIKQTALSMRRIIRPFRTPPDQKKALTTIIYGRVGWLSRVAIGLTHADLVDHNDVTIVVQLASSVSYVDGRRKTEQGAEIG